MANNLSLDVDYLPTFEPIRRRSPRKAPRTYSPSAARLYLDDLRRLALLDATNAERR